MPMFALIFGRSVYQVFQKSCQRDDVDEPFVVLVFTHKGFIKLLISTRTLSSHLETIHCQVQASFMFRQPPLSCASLVQVFPVAVTVSTHRLWTTRSLYTNKLGHQFTIRSSLYSTDHDMARCPAQLHSKYSMLYQKLS